jgi:hypothetical protein
VSCEPEPPLGSILRIHTLPEARGLELHRDVRARACAETARQVHRDIMRKSGLPEFSDKE